MNLFSNDDLELLAHHREEPSVSVYLPLERGGPQKKEDEIRLKNMLREVERQLAEEGIREGEIEQLLESGYRLLNDLPYMEHDSDGLAMFIAPELFRYYRLPARFTELAVVSDEFHIKPLIPLLTDDGRYYVLALSQNKVRLLQCTHYSLREVELKDTPTSMAEALRFDEVQSMHQGHAGGPTGAGNRGGMVFHTQADDSDKAVHKENVHQFLHQVENGIRKLLSGQKAPLVLAGVEEIRAMYAQANTYPHLVEGGLDGNPDRMKSADLQRAAWDLVEPRFTKAREDAIAAYWQLAGGERASERLTEVLQAAEIGRVQFLLVDLERQRWGSFDPRHSVISVHEEEEPGDEDLVNRAALHTLLHGGRVFALESERMPDGQLVAAVFRY